MLWACVLLPQLALDGVMRRHGNPDEPLALISGSAQRRVLQSVNPAARALGLKAGQSLTAAQALVPNFTTIEHDPADIERLQQLLAAWAYGFSSNVSLKYPRVLLMEIESSLKLFGPWPVFEARLREELITQGFRHRIVVAPNPIAARMLANMHDGLSIDCPHELRRRLEQMPLERIGLSRETATALTRMGLRSLRQVLALPRDTLARRFPASVLQHLDTLLGERPVALECYTPPDFFDVRIELNFDVESHQALLFPLKRLIADLVLFLAGRDSGVQRFSLHLEHVPGPETFVPETVVPVGLLSAERDASMLFELARGRLEQVLVASPVRAVRLLARDLPDFVPAHRQLFDERVQQTLPWEQLRERLRARLGDESVNGLRAQADYRPECAWQAHSSSKPVLPARGFTRPGWLLREPQPLPVQATRIVAGPERIESGWWDGGDVRRDYYLVETASGQRAWAYRAVGEPGELLLHGWFA
ncbi:DNA polymerase Y family protein [Pseudomonas syringae]|uniref:DNA polymerase Y family protein n=1 Tax=Pseudomonas syringae TaxID=317 RepID=A0A6B2B275_PSESX|nr:DNA polymerase Y family protein [Pseudomonas syringae]MBI6561917.1 DNA polymerase Y family protein [Pseudomonas syringae]MBI6570759.1 DNA polymerase Y family protein [Pseudomonas syringae]MBI6585385.1 DNA polymerase Y family protein [Pseudomonas syringae]MBI6595294.1 DNA polymerase Y family protein [Pseudomonas syringae]MDC6491901.1 DNA polymerase Y family protein [Pseudomonas syringae]